MKKIDPSAVLSWYLVTRRFPYQYNAIARDLLLHIEIFTINVNEWYWSCITQTKSHRKIFCLFTAVFCFTAKSSGECTHVHIHREHHHDFKISSLHGTPYGMWFIPPQVSTVFFFFNSTIVTGWIKQRHCSGFPQNSCPRATSKPCSRTKQKLAIKFIAI